ncbi:MAG: hypothetical protein ABI216_20990 [Devosia sp.]
MRGIFGSLFVVALLGVSSSAMASMSITKGVIASFDPNGCTVTLVDKSVFSFGNRCSFAKLTVGENVEIVWASPQAAGVRAARYLMAIK